VHHDGAPRPARVRLRRALLATTAVLAALGSGLQAAPALADTALVDGDFVGAGADVYRIVGGAPVHLES
jgi:hypothetical protein